MYDEFYYNEEQEMLPEFNAYLRVGFLNENSYMSRYQQIMTGENIINRIKYFIMTIVQNPQSSMLNNDDMQILSESFRKLPFFQFKNPISFVMGYVATEKGTRKITPEKVDDVLKEIKTLSKILPELSEIGIVDIIKYGSLWEKINFIK